jgi:hypothetical protein
MKPTIGQAIDNMVSELVTEREWWKDIVRESINNDGKMTQENLRKAKNRLEPYDDF